MIPKVRTFPVTEQRKLTAWFGITSQNEADSWLAAWQAAEGVHVTSPVFYDPEAHLAMYLSRCRTERRTPRADLWLRFFIEDRAKHMETIAHVQERVARQDEDPQQREDRTTRALPPADWGTTGEEVPDEG